MNIILLVLLTLGIIIIKTVWIRTELHFSKKRFNLTMVKTNGIEALIIVLQILASIYTPVPKTPFNGILIVVGTLMYIVGYILAFWGRTSMSKSWGIPGEHVAKQNKLITTGPFAFSRNPIYIGFLLIYFGYAAAILSWLIILRIPLAFYFYKSAKLEEKKLEHMFGKQYLDYKAKVPRFI